MPVLLSPRVPLRYALARRLLLTFPFVCRDRSQRSGGKRPLNCHSLRKTGYNHPAARNARKEKQIKCDFASRSFTAPSNAEAQFFAGWVRCKVDGAVNIRRTDSHDPRTHEQAKHLFVLAVFSSTGRGAFSFVKTKENGGRISCGEPAVPSRPAGENSRPGKVPDRSTGHGRILNPPLRARRWV